MTAHSLITLDYETLIRDNCFAASGHPTAEIKIVTRRLQNVYGAFVLVEPSGSRLLEMTTAGSLHEAIVKLHNASMFMESRFLSTTMSDQSLNSENHIADDTSDSEDEQTPPGSVTGSNDDCSPREACAPRNADYPTSPGPHRLTRARPNPHTRNTRPSRQAIEVRIQIQSSKYGPAKFSQTLHPNIRDVLTAATEHCNMRWGCKQWDPKISFFQRGGTLIRGPVTNMAAMLQLMPKGDVGFGVVVT